MHCAEDISEAINIGNTKKTINVEMIREALATINLCIKSVLVNSLFHEGFVLIKCARHQKTIVDDVLSFSKLDASLLSLKPTVCEPSKTLKTTLKMVSYQDLILWSYALLTGATTQFQHEFRKEKLHFNFIVESEYDALPVRSVMADMPRVGQVLINLMTNAIKFTQRGTGEKRISCAVSASKVCPPENSLEQEMLSSLLRLAPNRIPRTLCFSGPKT